MKIGITVGAFDLCHYGHFLMFKEAKEICDYLIVGLHTDPQLASKNYRGKKKTKPIMSAQERYEVLSGIKYIDEIFLYKTEANLLKMLKEIKWDVRIIGADWKGKKFTGWEIKREVYYNSRNHNFSTTELKERIIKSIKKSRQSK